MNDMSMNGAIEGVYLSTTLDLENLYSGVLANADRPIRLRRPEEVENPEKVRFALCWYPAAQSFDAYPNLKLASSIAAGVDHIVNCPSLPTDAIVTRVRDEHQASLMAAFAAWHVVWHHRSMGFHLASQARGEWARRDFDEVTPPPSYTVGILGYGLMGQAIARAVAAMGFPVVAAARSMRDAGMGGVDLETGPDAVMRTASRSNVLINVLPLTRDTHDILNADLFAAMPRGSALIQLGRGEHMVDADLDAALESGQIAGASLDVFRQEPLPKDHHWWRDPRIVITPHQASDCSRATVVEQVARAVIDVSEGRRPITAVDRERGY